MENYLAAHGVEPVPFRDYWHFRDARSWRMLAEKTDFYFGDRFHGGVVSLQVGKPALFVYRDLRVEELTTHIGAPNISFDDLEGRDCLEVASSAFSAESLEKFRDTYEMRAREYYDICAAAGMTPLEEIRRRSVRRAGPQHGWQQPLAEAVCKTKKRKDLPAAVRAALNIISLDQDNNRSCEILIRALVSEGMHKECDAISTLMTDVEGEELEWKDAEYFFRMAYFLTGLLCWQDALKFAEVYYNKIYKRIGQHTELYATIQIELGNYEAAEAALTRRADDEGFEVIFAVMQAKVSALAGRIDEAKERIVAAKAMEDADQYQDRFADVERFIAEPAA